LECIYKIYMINSKYAKNGKFAYYVCGTLDKKGSHSCLTRYINADKLESQVIQQVKECILTRENLIELVRLVNEEMDSNMQNYQKELELISHNINEVNQRLERLYDVVETGKLNLDDVIARIRDLQKRQQDLQSRRIEIESMMSDKRVELTDLETIFNYVEDLHGLLRNGTLTERKAFIKSFVKDIKVTGNEAVLSYSMPEIPEKIIVEKDGVLPSVHYSGPLWTRTTDPSLIRTVL
jgi:site-specific DNA recombinase